MHSLSNHFLIYFSDVSEVIDCEKAIYADDSSIWQSHENLKEIEEMLQISINNKINFVINGV